ncbi:hypothetical protein AV530_015497 [Patagioenas fasciata monilis]|uniref:Uncharacterized protein n=1 Tax=Patagioenas fasciata monilis TaxID=372326 RepID=A0A1V4KRU4_PATFA|nr:hypothetical protein AV530_015497 [Patagioenas fasciata monilis]
MVPEELKKKKAKEQENKCPDSYSTAALLAVSQRIRPRNKIQHCHFLNEYSLTDCWLFKNVPVPFIMQESSALATPPRDAQVLQQYLFSVSRTGSH